MKTMAKLAGAALLSAAAFAISAGSAAAYVVCNAEGDCWHTDNRYHYRPGVHVEFHPDSWYFHRDWDNDRDRHWRGHHEGRGYWRNGVWVTF
ncbi:MAG TPA: hypothetical protein VKT24_01345 [Rhizomicrobium sp.]|nr:hypothetical protein [Rhizomicrobium sp.]